MEVGLTSACTVNMVFVTSTGLMGMMENVFMRVSGVYEDVFEGSFASPAPYR